MIVNLWSKMRLGDEASPLARYTYSALLCAMGVLTVVAVIGEAVLR